MRIVVEGCGSWAMQYFKALKDVVIGTGRQDVGVFFTYDTTFGNRSSEELYSEYLRATLVNIREIEAAGFPCIDAAHRQEIPERADVVFVVTPDRTHCDMAERWLGKARLVFVEKPFDVTAERIQQFCDKLYAQEYTKVFGVDHYLVRCNEAAADHAYFLHYLQTADITSFEFCMTEPPGKDGTGNYDATPVRKRALSLQAGMGFDMGSHALPMLLPFIDITQTIHLLNVWAGISEGLRDIILEAETGSIAELQCHTRRTRSKPDSQVVVGRCIVGKDLGDRPQKYLLLEGPGGKVRFDLVDFKVYHEPPDGRKVEIAALYKDWVQFFVREVLEGRIPEAVELFQPGFAVEVVRFLEQWRERCHSNAAGEPRSLLGYAPGAPASALKNEAYRC